VSAALPPVRVSASWLRLREAADAAARAEDLLEPVREVLAAGPERPADGLVIRDLGCGTGAMGRWLAGRLPGPQHWVLYDLDPDLLRHAAAGMAGAAAGGTPVTAAGGTAGTAADGRPVTAADGTPVTVATRRQDVTRLTAGDLAGTTLVTASALLDLFTGEEVAALAAACVRANCPALLTLSVVGRVTLTPADPLDEEINAAFNAHQRRHAAGRKLLGPDAVDAAATEFDRLGARVRVRPSPWRLDGRDGPLQREWLRAWVGAACKQRPDLATAAAAYLDRRLTAATAGELRVVVGHSDLLAYQP